MQRRSSITQVARGRPEKGKSASTSAAFRQRENELRRANRALRTISSCNQALIHATTETGMLEEICRVIVADGGYRLAWVGYAEHDKKKTVRPVASAGYESGYLEKADITWADEPRGRGPTGTAIRTRQPAVCRNVHADPKFEPWRKDAIKRGYASSIVLPLQTDGTVLGAVSIYATEPDAFDQEEVKLLQELADDLVFGIMAVRAHVGRLQAEEALQTSTRQLSLIYDHISDVLFFLAVETDGHFRFVSVNPAFLRVTGLTEGQVVGKRVEEVIPASALPLVLGKYREAVRTQKKVGWEEISEYPAGRRYGVVGVTPIIDAGGNCTRLVGIVHDITERQLAEQAARQSQKRLREEEARFHALVEKSYEAVAVLDASGHRTYASPSTERFLGYRTEELIGRSAFEFVHPEDRDLATAGFGELAHRPGSTKSLELRIVRRDGSVRWFDVTGTNLLHIPSVQGVVLNYRDITERKLAETALRDSETQFRQLFDQMLSGVLLCEVICDESGVPRDHRFLDGNAAFEKLTGISVREQRGKTGKDFAIGWPPEVVERLYRVAMTGEPIEYSRYNETLGRTYETRVISPRRGQFAHIFHDITERKRAEESLRKEQALFQSLVTAIPDKVYFKDRQSRFVQINAAMAQRFGLRSGAEAVGKTDFDIFTEVHARQAYADEQRIMETGEPMIGVEEKETWPDGRVTWVSSTKVPLRDAEGKITGLVGISRDITDRKKLETQYLQAQKLEAFGQLAGGVAHDFNNILGVMLMQLNLLQVEPGLSGAVVSGLSELERHALRGAGLTRQLLMFSRRREMEPRVLDLNVVLEDVSKLLRRLLGEDIAFELNKAAAPLWIEGDAGMVEQVAMNLCINARDAMREGGRLTVALRSEVRPAPASAGGMVGECCCLEVTDTGCGMDEATKARIFEPFFTTKAAGKGTGLGLATVYGIMQQHRGWVEVDSAPNRGSTFRAYFPLHERPVPPGEEAALQDSPGGHEAILLVEDEPALRSSMNSCLQHSGYRVVEAANGKEALGKWEEGRREFDLVITDYVMPEGLTGVQLATQLTRAKAELKVIVMSGHIPAARDSATPWPVDFTRLMKPFEIRKLLQTVRHCLDVKPVT